MDSWRTRVEGLDVTEETFGIVYTFRMEDGQEFRFPVEVDAETLQLRYQLPETLPAWTSLEQESCHGCSLDRSRHRHCPAALAVLGCVERFSRLLSYTEVEVMVESNGRTVQKRTTVQKALSSLLGLIMATSGCPSLAFLKPMARFHQPFATRLETLYRAASAYMLAQYFLNKHSRPCDLDLSGLQRAYERIHQVNMGMARRLRGASASDANMNALVLLDLFAQEFPEAIGDQMRELEHLFEHYLKQDWRPEDIALPRI